MGHPANLLHTAHTGTTCEEGLHFPQLLQHKDPENESRQPVWSSTAHQLVHSTIPTPTATHTYVTWTGTACASTRNGRTANKRCHLLPTQASKLGRPHTPHHGHLVFSGQRLDTAAELQVLTSVASLTTVASGHQHERWHSSCDLSVQQTLNTACRQHQPGTASPLGTLHVRVA